MLARLTTLTSGMLLAGGLVFTQAALGLGLGEITLNSSLDEPLDATVELLDIGGLDETQILIALGSEEDFARVDLDRTQFLTGIAFAVELNGDTGIVRLTTATNVAEPYLDFIITARWPDGTVAREYTLLVDLPDFTSNAAEPQPAASTSAASPAAQSAAEPAQAAAPAVAATAGSGDGTFTVNPGDTLWEIAEATRPDNSVSVQQMMVAIQRANQDAFVGNDINRVRTGRVLRIPELQEIAVIDQSAAIAQINQQDPGNQPLAVNTGNAGGNTAPQRDELSVLTADDAVANGAGSSDLAATIAALENELMLSEENLDRARLENLELNNRISALQDEIDLLQNIIAIEDERIAQLQAELTSQSQATAQALAQAQNAATELSALENEQQSGLMDQLNGILQNGLILFGTLLALVLAVLGFLVLKRRRDQAEAEELAFNPALAGVGTVEPVDTHADVAKAGFMAGLLARFRRPKDADGDDVELGDEAIDLDNPPPIAAAPVAPLQEPVVVVAPVVAVPVVEPRQDTDELLEDLGISDEMLSLDDALSSIDETATAEQQDQAALAAFDASIAEDAELLSALDLDKNSYEIAPANVPDKLEFSVAPAVPVEPELPETVEFTPVSLPPVVVVADAVQDDAAAQEDAPEAFEFTLREEVVSPVAVAAAVEAEKLEEPEEELESFEFTLRDTPDSSDGNDSDVIDLDSEIDGDLGSLSFDDTMLADPDEDESPYKSRSGMDECDTKLDLATAYEAMGDVSEAVEILDEVIAEGNQSQVEMARRLKQSWQSA